MIIDSFTALKITSWIFSDAAYLTGFIGFLMVFGTVLGTFIDLIFHHNILKSTEKEIVLKWLLVSKKERDKIINKTKLIKDARSKLLKYTQQNVNPEIRTDAVYKKGYEKFFTYFLPYVGRENYQHLISEFYSYSEFYANLGFATVPFTVGLILYFNAIWQFPCYPWLFVALLYLAILIGLYITRICLIGSIETEQKYRNNFIQIAWGAIIKAENKKKKEVNNGEESPAKKEEEEEG
jgi:hypothetical protein